MSGLCFVCVSWMFPSYLRNVSMILWCCVKTYLACTNDVFLAIFKCGVGDVSGVVSVMCGDSATWYQYAVTRISF